LLLSGAFLLELLRARGGRIRRNQRNEADLTTIQEIRTLQTVVELLALRRDKDNPGTYSRSIVQNHTVKLSEDDKTLTFALRVPIDVMEEMGVCDF
jgi:hypothetical protein